MMPAIAPYFDQILQQGRDIRVLPDRDPAAVRSIAVNDALAADNVSPRSLLKPIASRARSLICLTSLSEAASSSGLPSLPISLRWFDHDRGRRAADGYYDCFVCRMVRSIS